VNDTKDTTGTKDTKDPQLGIISKHPAGEAYSTLRSKVLSALSRQRARCFAARCWAVRSTVLVLRCKVLDAVAAECSMLRCKVLGDCLKVLPWALSL